MKPIPTLLWVAIMLLWMYLSWVITSPIFIISTWKEIISNERLNETLTTYKIKFMNCPHDWNNYPSEILQRITPECKIVTNSKTLLDCFLSQKLINDKEYKEFKLNNNIKYSVTEKWQECFISN